MKSYALDMLKRCLLAAIGCIFTGAGVAAYYATNLGSDPISLWCDGLHNILNISYGQASFLNTSVWILILLVVYRKYLNLGTVIIWTTMSVWIDVFTDLFNVIAPVEQRGIIHQGIFLVIGIVFLAIGISVQHVARAGCSGVEAVVLSLRDWMDKPYKYVRMGWDALFAVLGVLLGGVVGLGTVIGVLITGPSVQLTDKLLSKPLLSIFRLDKEPKTLKQYSEEEKTADKEIQMCSK